MKRKIIESKNEYLLNICNTLLHSNLINKKELLNIKKLIIHKIQIKGVLSHCLTELDRLSCILLKKNIKNNIDYTYK